MMHRLLALCLLALSSVADLAQGAPDPEGPTRVLTGATLVDGTGAGPRPGVSIVLRGERITAVVHGWPEDLPRDAEVVDLDGRYVVPGLIDAHTHLASDPSREGFREDVEATLREMLGRGVTQVRDMAGDGRVLGYLARQTRLGELAGPEIHFAALIAGPRFFRDPRAISASRGVDVDVGGTPWARAVTSETDLDRLMHEVRGLGASGVKVYADLEPGLVAAVVEAAHRNDLPVWAHWVVAPGRTRALDAVEAGVDVVSHAFMLMHDAPPSERVSAERVLAAAGGDALFDAMRERGTILDATLVAAVGMRAPNGWVEPLECAAEVVRTARARGVAVAAGSDHPGDGELPGIHLELGLLVERAGLSPLEAVRAATDTAARALGTGDRTGTIEAGKLATLLVLDDDPTRSVAALAEPLLVFQRGRAWSGPALRASTAVAPLDEIPALDDE